MFDWTQKDGTENAFIKHVKKYNKLLVLEMVIISEDDILMFLKDHIFLGYKNKDLIIINLTERFSNIKDKSEYEKNIIDRYNRYIEKVRFQ